MALTLRYDRLDHFWFTLFHELAHVALHLDSNKMDVCFDDLSANNQEESEKQAEKFASDALIPAKAWEESGLSKDFSAAKVREYAKKWRIHPAIPAGRIRYEKKNYKLLKDLVGNGCVRKQFEFHEKG